MASSPRSRRRECKSPRSSSTTRLYPAHCRGPARCLVWRSIRPPESTSWTTASTRSTCCIAEGASKAGPARRCRARGPPQCLSDPDLGEYACEIGTDYLLGDCSRVAALQQLVRDDFDPAWHVEPGHIDRSVFLGSR